MPKSAVLLPSLWLCVATGGHASAEELTDDASFRPRPTYQWIDVSGVEPTGHTSKTIYLNRCEGGCTITPAGYSGDDSRSNRSSIVNSPVQISEFRYSDDAWNEVVHCVRKMYEPFDIEVTDVDPGSQSHFEAIVAGSPAEIGRSGIGGIAPFSCGIINNAISFSFANIYGSTRAICETVAQETAHAFGLEHELLCSDPMTYLPDCGAKAFQDTSADCGEFEARQCQCRAGRQNSYALLLGHFGPGQVVAPEVDFTRPRANSNVMPGFGIEIDATDDIEVDRVELYIDGNLAATVDSAPYVFNAPDGLVGLVSLEARAYDNSGAMGSQAIEVNVGEPCDSDDTCPDGRICFGGFCVAGPDVDGGLGGTCEKHEDCDSALCGQGADGGGLCTAQCSTGAELCPDGFECLDVGGDLVGICWPKSGGADGEGDAGCAASGSKSQLSTLFLLLGAALLHRRRRRLIH